ncbi:Mitochondrial distribution and morphology protein 31, mitochondrial precursor [Mortierella sp. AD011]|nr:Mitochondrial distribution and morphology protein 31, mitochondrial precursor [Mortierella sp. AD010]KAF9401571.1 Mitochondrial distribution and morphology protein 31, mitochondrial precursor [Mortierella sp. AD011]
MQTSCLARRGPLRPLIANRALACSKYSRLFSSIRAYGRPSKRQILCKLAPGLWIYNNGGIYGGEAAVAVNQTTQQVIMQRSGVASLSSSSSLLGGTTASPRSKGVRDVMNRISERTVQNTMMFLSKPQPRTTPLQEAGHRGFSQSSQQQFPVSSQSRYCQTLNSQRTDAFSEVSPCIPPSTQSKSTHLSAYARTKVAPSNIRSNANNGSKRTFATEARRSHASSSSTQNALVKYTPPIGPLDRVDRARLLSAAPNSLARLKLRFKLLLMRQIRPWRVDDFIAMFSWAFLANVAFVLLGTTTFFSLILATANSLQFQGFVASKISDYLTASTGVKVKFEAAIVPNWKDGRITLRNVVMSKRAVQPTQSHQLGHNGEDHSGHKHEHDHDHDGERNAQLTEEEIDTNFTMFDLTVDQIDVTLSAKRWLDGKGLIEDASIKGVRGVIDRTNVWWDPDVEYIPEEARRKHVPGDFELESLQLEDMLVTVLQPDNFRPYTVSIFSAQFPKFRKQWICYDMLCAESMVGMFDGCLFSCYNAQRSSIDGQTDTKWKRATRFKIDDVKIDHLNAGVEGPFGWIYSGTVDITCDVKIPNEPREDVLRKLVNDIVDKIDEVVDFAPLPLVFGTGAIGGKEIVMYPNRAAAALHQKLMEEEEEQRRYAKEHGLDLGPEDEHHRLHHENRHRYLLKQQKIEQEYRQYQQQQEQIKQQLTEQQRQQHQQQMPRLHPAVAAARSKAKKPALVMDFEFRFNDTKASIPLQTESISYLSNAAIRPIVAFMNSNRTVTPIRCRVELDLSEFDGSWTVYDSNLMSNLSTEVGKAWANLVADERERNRKLKRVGLWGLQSMTRNIVSVYDYARGNRGFWHYIGTQHV